MDIYTKVAEITNESVKDYKNHALPNHMVGRQEMRQKQIENALQGFAAGCAEEEIEAFCDTSVFANGKRGFLFSKKGLYGSIFDHLRRKNPIPQPICYDELSYVSVAEDSADYMCLYYKDGRRESVWGSIYTGFLVIALNLILGTDGNLPTSNTDEMLKNDKNDESEYSYETARRCLQEGLDNLEMKNEFAKVHYYYQAAKEGNPVAMEAMALCYAQGKEVPQSYEKALYWIGKGVKYAPEHLAETAEQIKNDAKEEAFIRNNPYIPELGKVIYIRDSAFLVLSRKLEKSVPGRRWVEMFVRELETGESGILTVGWNPQDEKLTFVSSYFSGYWSEKEDFEFPEQKVIAERYAGRPIIILEDLESYLDLQCTAYNIAYTGSDCELRLCYFQSIDTFQDWKTYELYKIPIFESNVTELEELRFEAPVEVCLWQGKAYFAATMERRIIEELFDDEIIFTKWDPELVDVYIEDEGREWELVEFSFFSKYANPLYPKETCSPLGMIVGKFHE